MVHLYIISWQCLYYFSPLVGQITAKKFPSIGISGFSLFFTCPRVILLEMHLVSLIFFIPNWSRCHSVNLNKYLEGKIFCTLVLASAKVLCYEGYRAPICQRDIAPLLITGEREGRQYQALFTHFSCESSKLGIFNLYKHLQVLSK